MTRYPEPKARGYHQAKRMTEAERAASTLLRQRAFASHKDRCTLAFVAGISLGHLNKWMSQSCDLSVEAQASLKRFLDSGI